MTLRLINSSSSINPPRFIRTRSSSSSGKPYTITDNEKGVDLQSNQNTTIGGAFQKIGTEQKNEDAMGTIDFPLALFPDHKALEDFLNGLVKKIAIKARNMSGGAAFNLTVIGTTPDTPHHVMTAQLGDCFTFTAEKKPDDWIGTLEERTPCHNVASGAGRKIFNQLKKISDWFEEKEGYISVPSSNARVQMAKGLGDADSFGLDEKGLILLTKDEQDQVFNLRSTPDIGIFELEKDNLIGVCTDGFKATQLEIPLTQASITHQGCMNGQTLHTFTTLYNLRNSSNHQDDQTISIIDPSQKEQGRGVVLITIDGHTTDEIQPMAIEKVYQTFQELYHEKFPQEPQSAEPAVFQSLNALFPNTITPSDERRG